MDLNLIGFAIVTVWASLSFCLTVRYARGIPSDGEGSDAMKQIRGAAQSDKWRWPSDMHRFIPVKASMKDIGVLMLALFQRLMRDRESFHPLVASCAFAHAASIVLMYWLGTVYFGALPALAVTLLFATSLWSYQVLLNGGYQVTALPFLLLCALCAELSGRANGLTLLALAFCAGACFALMNFSSASARKWIPLAVSAFFYGQRNLLDPFAGIADLQSAIASSPALLSLFGVAVLALIAWLLTAVLFNPMVRAIHSGDAPKVVLDTFMAARSTTPLADYLSRRRRLLMLGLAAVIVIVAFPWVSLALSPDPAFHSAELAFLTGSASVAAVLVAPHFLGNLRNYVNYWIVARTSPHLPLYRDLFRSLDVPYPKRISAGGWSWHPRFLMRMAPFHLIAAVIATAYCFLIAAFDASAPGEGLLKAGAIALLSVSPILWGEFTDSPKFARTYYPELIGLLVPIGAILDRLSPTDTPVWIFIGAYLALAAVWNLRILLVDIWPARMAAERVARAVDALGEADIATYGTVHNNNLAECLPPRLRARLRRISSLTEMPGGFVLVPGITRFAPNLQSEREAIEKGDMRQDPALNELINSGRLAEVSVASFKTLGSSPYWSQESEILSYLELALGRIGARERALGRAWLVDAVRANRLVSAPEPTVAVSS
jgi:hypothetical protein